MHSRSQTAEANSPNISSAQSHARISSRLRVRQRTASSPIDTIAKLSNEVRQLEAAGRNRKQLQAFSTGCAALDNCLPDGGYTPGCVIEYLRTVPACGASYLALAAAASAISTSGGYLIVVDTQHNIYPPALTSLGIDLAKVVFVRPQCQADALWAVDQSLRTPAIAAVVADLEHVDDRSARRMQLAAEQGDGIALLLRSAAARNAPSWAEVQWLVRPLHSTVSPVHASPAHASPAQPIAPLVTAEHHMQQQLPQHKFSALSNRRLEVQLARLRGGPAGRKVLLEVDSVSGRLQSVSDALAGQARDRCTPRKREDRHEHTGTVHLATELAGAKTPSRRATAG